MSRDPIDAASVELPMGPLLPDQVVEGEPRTGHLPVDERDGLEIGIWEHSAGVSTDVEADEWFVVLSGDATVTFGGDRAPLELRPGMLTHLEQGDRTTWTVRTPLRKVYVARPPAG